MEIRKVSLKDKVVHNLIDKLDKYQLGLYGEECCNLDSVEELEKCNAYILGAYYCDELAGIGAIKLFDDYAEIKRMYFEECYRGSGFAGNLLESLEQYSVAEGISLIYLETGYLQKAALSFYKKHGYREVHSFGNYKPNKVSIYLGKKLYSGQKG